jgi:hypothetical protein
MFTFLNSAILLALAAATIPLILHLLNRQRRKNIPFSTIRFLKLLEKQRLKRLKLYQYLLILIRTLIILFLVLAFARPTFTGQSSISSGARTTAVIILDDGIHMRRYDEKGNRFFRALNKVGQLTEQFQADDQVFIVLTHAPSSEVTDIEQLQCSFSESNWTDAFRRSYELFKAYPNFNRELYIVSDFQFREPKWEDIEPSDDTRCYLFPVSSGPVSNVSIDTVRFTNTLFEINKTVHLDVVLRNQSKHTADDVECHLYIAGKRVAHQRLNLQSGESQPLTLTFQPKSFGELKGYVEIDDDDLLADNRYYFSILIPERLDVLYVDDTPSSFITAAWSAVQENSNIVITKERFRSWGRQGFSRYQTICMANMTGIADAMIGKLKNYLQNGGGLILMPGINTVPVDFNRFCENLGMNIKMQELVQSKKAPSFFTLTTPSLNHPLFSGLFRTIDPEIEKPRFQRYFKYLLEPGNKAILSLNNGDPYLVVSKVGKGSVYLLGGYVDEQWTDLQYRGLFIPLFVRLFYLSSATASQNQSMTIAGKNLYIDLDQSKQKVFSLVDPDETENRIIPESFDPQLSFSLNQLHRPGHYSLKAGDAHIHSISVNVPTAHIIDQSADFTQIGNNVSLFSEEDLFSDEILHARIGLELWKWAVFITILLIIAELLLVKKTQGNN